MACEIKLVAVEGIGEGSIACRATLDKQTLAIERNLIMPSHYGTLKLEFVTDSVKDIGVIFPLRLLKNVNFQYIPLYRPIASVDSLPEEVEKPRALISHFPCSVTSSAEEEEQESEEFKQQTSQFKELEYSLKKKIIDLEYSLDTEARRHHIELSNLKSNATDTQDKLRTDLSVAHAKTSVLKDVSNDLLLQRDSLAEDVENLIGESKNLKGTCNEYKLCMDTLEKKHKDLMLVVSKLTSALRDEKIENRELKLCKENQENYIMLLESHMNQHIEEENEADTLKAMQELACKMIVNCENLQRENEDLAYKNELSAQELVDTYAKIEEIQGLMTQESEFMNTKLTNTSEEYESIVTELKSQIEASKQTNQALYDENMTYKEKANKRKDTIAFFKKVKEDHEIKIQEYIQDLEDSNQFSLNLQAQLKELTEECKQNSSDKKNFSDLYNQSVNRETALKEKLDSAYSDILEYSAQQNNTQESLQKTQTDLQNKLKTCQLYEQRMKKLENSIKRLGNREKLQEEENYKLLKTIRALERTGHTKDEYIVVQEESINRLESEIESHKRESQGLKADLSDLLFQIEEHKIKTNSLEMDVQKSELNKQNTDALLEKTYNELLQACDTIKHMKKTEVRLEESLIQLDEMKSLYNSAMSSLTAKETMVNELIPYTSMYESSRENENVLKQQLQEKILQIEDIEPFIQKYEAAKEQETRLDEIIAFYKPYKELYETSKKREEKLEDELKCTVKSLEFYRKFEELYESSVEKEISLSSKLETTSKYLEYFKPFEELYEKTKDNEENLSHSLKDCKETLSEVSEILTSTQNKLSSCEQRESSLQKLLAETQSNLTQSKASESQLQSQLSKLNQEILSLVSSDTASKEIIEINTSKIDDLSHKLQESDSSLKNSQEQVANLTSSIGNLNSQLDETSKNLETAIQRETDLKIALKNTTYQHESTLSALENSQSELEESNSAKESLFSKLEAIESLLQNTQQDLDYQISVNGDLRESLMDRDIVLKDNKHLKMRLENSLATAEDMRQSMAEGETLREEVNHLNKIVTDQDTQIAILDENLSKANKDKINAYKTLCEVLSTLGHHDKESVDKLLSVYLAAYNHPNNFVKIGDGIYCYGNKKVGICIRNGALVVRVGGGYMYIEEFLKVNMPPEFEDMLERSSTPIRTNKNKNQLVDSTRKKNEDSENTPIEDIERGVLSPINIRRSPLT